MTGTGTQTDPYIVDNWADFIAIDKSKAVYVKWADSDNRIIDFNDIQPDGYTKTIYFPSNIDFNGWTFRNFHSTASTAINYKGDSYIIENLIFENFYIMLNTSIYGEYILKNCIFSGFMQSSSAVSAFNGCNLLNCAVNIRIVSLYSVILASSSGFIHPMEIRNSDIVLDIQSRGTNTSKISYYIINSRISGKIELSASPFRLCSSGNGNIFNLECNQPIKYTTDGISVYNSDLAEKVINISEFEQGSIGSSGNTDSIYKVRTTGYIRANPSSSIIISAASSDGKAIQINLLGYADNTTNNNIFDLYWYDSPHIFDLLSYSNTRYLRLVFRNKDGTEISSSDMAESTIVIENLWHTDTNGELRCDNMPYAPEKAIYSHFATMLWRSSGDIPTHELFPTVPEKAMKKPYPLSLWRIDYISSNIPYHRLFPNIPPIHIKAVPQNEYIIIYDKSTPQDGFSNNGLAVLEPVSCTVTENFNASWTVTLEHSVDSSQKWKYIKEFNILKVLGQLFVIKKTEHSWSGNSGKVVAYAEHIFYYLNDLWIKKGAVIAGYDGQRLIQNALSHAFTENFEGGTGYHFGSNSDITSESSSVEMSTLAYVKWQPTQNAMTPIEFLLGNDGFTANFGGDLYRDNFYFSINEKMENAVYNSFDIHVGLNLCGIRRTVDTSSLCTHFTAYDKFGSGVSVRWSAHGGVPHHIVRSQEFSFGENYTESNMDLIGYEAKKYFGLHKEPQIDITVDLEDVKNNPEYIEFANNPRYKVGDRGRIYDERLEISFDAHITHTVKDGITGKNLEITFSSISGFTNMGDYDISVDEIPATPESPDIPEEISDYRTVET